MSGVVITATSTDLPASNAGLRAGMILTSLNGTVIRNEAEFKSALLAVPPESTVPISALEYNSTAGQYVNAGVTSLTTISKNDYYQSTYGQSSDNISFMARLRRSTRESRSASPWRSGSSGSATWW